MKLQNLTRTHQLVLGAIMAAINVIFNMISAYLFGFSLLIMLFLPLASVVVALNVDFKHAIVYFFGTLFLSLVLSFGNIENTLFMLLPILVSGLAFGYLIRYKLSDLFIILIVSGLNLLTLLITIPLINLIYQINFIEVFSTFIGFQDIAYGRLVLPSILTMLAFMQTLITLFVISSDAKLYGVDINRESWRYTSFLNLGLLLLSYPLFKFFPDIGLCFLFIHLFLSVYTILATFKKNTLFAVVTAVLTLFAALLGIALFDHFHILQPYFGVILAIFPVVILDILWLYISRFKKVRKNEGII